MFLYKKTMTVANVLGLFCLLMPHTHTALTQQEIFGPNEVSATINSFSMKLLAKTSGISLGAFNLALSPYTIWTLMTIIHEGAQDHTAAELGQVLGIPSCGQACQDNFRQSYRTLSNFLSNRARDVIFNLANGVFVEDALQVNPEFERVARNVYGVNVMPTDFRDRQRAARYINKYLAGKTGQLINDFVNAEMLQGTQLYLTSALYFKGFWQTPFNKTATRKATFFNEHRKPLGEVDMMYLRTHVPFTMIFDRRAAVAELKYGDGDRISMIVIVPTRNTFLREILALLADTPFSKILEALNESSKKYLDEDVIVYLPKFKITADFVMNTVLESMGIKDVFSNRANLSGISPTKELFVSQVLQRAVIQVDEDGTTAAAAGGASIINKSPPGELRANRPFAYFIVDKPSQTVLFAGTIENPKF